MWNRVERVVLVLVGIAAIASAAVFILREFNTRSAINAADAVAPIEFVSGWRDVLPVSSTLFGDDKKQAQIIVVSDYECPFCARFEDTIDLLDTTSLSVRILHLPLRQHRFSRQSAIAAVCAGDQGRFREMHKMLLSAQDSIGLVSFREFAQRAGVGDLETFEACRKLQRVAGLVDSSQVAARMLGARGTPTILVNGWKYGGTPSLPVIKSDIDRVLQGLEPDGRRQ